MSGEPPPPLVCQKFTDAEHHRLQEAGEAYSHWLNTHPDWGLPCGADNIDAATEQKSEG
jgi:hypothetical protein